MKTKKRTYSKLCLVYFTLVFLSFNAFAKQKAAAPTSTSTLENLLTAFNGESNANAKYLAFAKKADEEGYGQAASLFRAAARAEQVHFERHAAVIKELKGTPKAKIETPVVKSTKENLEDAFKGETHESTVMYPAFLAKARKDKIKSAIDAFEDAGAAEAVHAKWYKKAIDNSDDWKGQKKVFYVCPLCGNVVDLRKGGKCPICKTAMEKFMPVN